jgi:hypothetical protein
MTKRTSETLAGRTIARVEGALSTWIRAIDVERGERSAALSFVHPVNGATVMVVVDEGDGGEEPATLAVFVVLRDFEDVRRDDGQLEQLLSLNASLMSCAVGLVRLNADERAVALCRRLPVEAADVGELRELIDAMIWEFARNAGWTEEPGPAAAARDPYGEPAGAS